MKKWITIIFLFISTLVYSQDTTKYITYHLNLVGQTYYVSECSTGVLINGNDLQLLGDNIIFLIDSITYRVEIIKYYKHKDLEGYQAMGILNTQPYNVLYKEDLNTVWLIPMRFNNKFEVDAQVFIFSSGNKVNLDCKDLGL